MAHFEIWNDKAGDAPPVDSGDGLVLPDLNSDPATTTSLVMPRPCKFISEDLPLCSVIRPTSNALAGATAAAQFLTETGLFQGQSEAFLSALFSLAAAADKAVLQGQGDGPPVRSLPLVPDSGMRILFGHEGRSEALELTRKHLDLRSSFMHV